jgi:uncharacterized protein (DUF433 family)
VQNKIITNFSEAAENIQSFAEELRQEAGLQNRLGTFKVWYVVEHIDQTTALAPSKFIGRKNNTAAAHLSESGGNGKRHGNDGKNILDQWFIDVSTTSAQHRHLWDALSTLYASYGKRPNPNARFRIQKEQDESGLEPFRHPFSPDHWIVHDPDICSGKPTLKGTRIRVVDVLQLLAGGDSVASILQDYPSLQRFHIDAALGYAAMALDHRVIRAA